MKLILHHFWKDIRSLRWILGLWLLVVLTQAVITVLAVQPSYQIASMAEMIAPSAIWYVINGAIWIAVIVYLIQSEPVTGATSFWLTRPIPPVISVFSKLIFIIGLVIVPSLIPRTIDLLLFGVPVHTVRDSVYATILVELMMALCVVWLATYTRNMAQFWGVVGTLCVLWIAGSLTLMFRSSIMTFTAETNPGLWASRFEMGFWVFFGGLIVSLVIQYWLRTTQKAFLLGLGSIFLSITCFFWWPFVLPRIGHGVANPPTNKTMQLSSMQLSYQIDPTKPFIWSGTQLLNTNYQSAKIFLIAPSGNGNGTACIRSIESSFTPNDGKKVALQAALEGYSYFTPDRLDWLTQLQHDNSGLTIESGSTPANEPVPAFMVTSELAGKLKDQIGTLNLKLIGDVLTLQKQAEIPLAGTGFARIPSALVRLIAVQNDKDGINLSVEEVGYRDMLKGKTLPTVYLLVDPQSRIGIIPLKSIIKSQNNNVSGSTLSRMSALLNLEVRATDLPENIRTHFEGEGVNGLIIYVYEATSQGHFEREVKVPDYKFLDNSYRSTSKVTSSTALPAINQTTFPLSANQVSGSSLTNVPAQNSQSMGKVLNAKGEPVANVEICLVPAGRLVTVADGQIDPKTETILSASDGGFNLDSRGEAGDLLVATNTYGYAAIAWEKFNGTVTLTPWAKVSGTAISGSMPITGKSVIVLLSIPPNPRSQTEGQVRFQSNATVDSQGSFVVDHTPAGVVETILSTNPMLGVDSLIETAHIETQGNQTATVAFGGKGITVTGKAEMPNDPDLDLNWDQMYWVPSPVGLNIPSGTPQAQADKMFRDYYASDTGKKALLSARVHYFHIQSDGCFKIENVPPGAYRLRIDFMTNHGPGKGARSVGNTSSQFEVKAGDTSVDIPLLKLHLLPKSRIAGGQGSPN
jgi:hypothetical protein